LPASFDVPERGEEEEDPLVPLPHHNRNHDRAQSLIVNGVRILRREVSDAPVYSLMAFVAYS